MHIWHSEKGVSPAPRPQHATLRIVPFLHGYYSSPGPLPSDWFFSLSTPPNHPKPAIRNSTQKTRNVTMVLLATNPATETTFGANLHSEQSPHATHLFSLTSLHHAPLPLNHRGLRVPGRQSLFPERAICSGALTLLPPSWAPPLHPSHLRRPLSLRSSAPAPFPL